MVLVFPLFTISAGLTKWAVSMGKETPYQDGFPGDAFTRSEERNLASVKQIDDMLPHVRVRKDSMIYFIAYLFYFPFGLFLAMVRLVIFLPLIGAVSCCVPSCCRTVFTRFVLCVFFGVWVKVSGSPDKDARVWAANHTSEMDALAIRAVGNPFILGYSFYLKLWWLKCSPLSLLNMVYVPQQSRSQGNDKARDNVRRVVQNLIDNETSPILVFPEGGLASGKIALLQYHKFMFSLGVPVQPIMIKLSRPLPINVNCEREGTTFFDNVFWFVFLPFQSFHLTFLDSVSKEDDEGVLTFTHRVQYITAKAMGIKASPFLYRDKIKWLKVKHKFMREDCKLQFLVDEKQEIVTVSNKSLVSGRKKNGKVRPSIDTVRARLIEDIQKQWNMTDPSFQHAVFLKDDISDREDIPVNNLDDPEDVSGNNVVQKTMFVFDVKPVGADTDLQELALALKRLTFEGLVNWGVEHQLIDVAFGIQKLRISVVVEDRVSLNDLEDLINGDGRGDEQIQSIDVFTMSNV